MKYQRFLIVVLPVIILAVLLFVSTTVLLAQEPTPTPTPTATRLFDIGDLLATREISGTPVYEMYEAGTPMPTLPPPVTATPPPQCLDPDHLRGNVYRNMVTGTNTLLDEPRAIAIVMAGTFANDDAEASGEEVGEKAGEFYSGMASMANDLSVILPVDIMIVVGIRLVVVLVISFIGLIGKIKTAVKWW